MLNYIIQKMKKNTVTLVLFLGLAAVTSFPLENNEERKWMMFPDDNGVLHNISLTKPESDFEPFFDVNRDVNFLLFTRKNPKNAHPLQLNNDASVRGSNINFKVPTIMISHGFLNKAESSMNVNIRDAFLDTVDYNVIIIDWSKGASLDTLYYFARQNVKKVAPFVGRFISFMEGLGLDVNNLHLVGHSLGAHVAGIAAATLGGRVASVVGLDPALPLFDLDKKHERIDASNAQYVEIIHTNGGLLGVMQPLGQADFYPNGGRSQPGCGTDITGSCSHSRAHKFFAESIRFFIRPFRAHRCQSFQQILDRNCYPTGMPTIMGGNIYRKELGVYNVATGDKEPFALG